MKKKNKIKIISCGWGVQSWTLAAMVALGDLEPVDYVLHSDTGWEMSYTYEFSQTWTPWLNEHGVKVYNVSDLSCSGQVVDSAGGVFIPSYTFRKNGNTGQLRRQCTGRWKIQPMLKFMHWVYYRQPTELWLGITFDEAFRAKDSKVKFITHRFPFLELKWRRIDCINYLEQHGLPSPGKSSCTFCPYHSKKFWEQMKRLGGADWEQALMVDHAIRNKRPPDPLFVHSAAQPLEKAVKIPEDDGYTQLMMFDENDEHLCDSGYCFL